MDVRYTLQQLHTSGEKSRDAGLSAGDEVKWAPEPD
jgi:hypothetical protein